MVAKSIYYKNNKVVKESEVDIVGMPKPDPNKPKPVFDLGPGRSFIYNDKLYMKTNRQTETHVVIVDVFEGAVYTLPKNTVVQPKLVTIKVEK